MITRNQSLSNVPYLPAPTQNVVLTSFAGMFQVQTEQDAIPGDEQRNRQKSSSRGTVKDFSKKSRKRLIEKMLKKREWTRPLFVTLTYTDEVFFGASLTYSQVKSDLDSFSKRLERLGSDLGLIWKLETETRKSGNHIGKIAPHFHLIIDGYTGDVAEFRQWLGQAWFEILRVHCARTRQPRIDVQVAKSRCHACYYVSKYVAKAVPTNQAERAAYYNSVGEWLEYCNNEPGRFWGSNASWIDTPGETIKLTPQQHVELRRLVRGWSKRRNRRFSKWLSCHDLRFGFSVYGLGDETENKIFVSIFRRMVVWLKETYPPPQ